MVERVSKGKSHAVGKSDSKRRGGLATAFSGYDDGSSCPEFRTAGWTPTCDCNCSEVVPCVVMDPFAGSGTTLQVAKDLGRHAIGIDLNPEYCKLAVDRLPQQAMVLEV